DALPDWDRKLFRRLNGSLSSTYFGNAAPLQVRVPRGQGHFVLQHLADTAPPTFSDSISYRVRTGDTLGRLAIRFNVPIADLRRLNGIHGNNIRAGKHLVIPVAANPTTARKNDQPQSQQHIVKPGDTFWTIGRRYGLSARTLASHNGHHINKTLYPGQLLLIPSTATETLRESASSLTAYIVERGDSLWSIAKQFNIRLTDLKKWNPIVGSNFLRPGQKLLVQAP
ncbi:MAG: LysM peptidoglycan-binding domain-containing protein, partial [Gammaproteobacteria bacterium]